MKISMFIGDIADAPAEAVCTSTNPRLSLMMGTGGAIRDRGGFEIHDECEKLLDEELEKTGERLMGVGTAHVTSAGRLSKKAVIHCIASDAHHQSSVAIVRACVSNALAEAEQAGCSSVALPVFGAGHAHLRFNDSLRVIAETLKASTSAVQQVFIVIYDPDRADDARRLLREIVPLS